MNLRLSALGPGSAPQYFCLSGSLFSFLHLWVSLSFSLEYSPIPQRISYPSVSLSLCLSGSLSVPCSSGQPWPETQGGVGVSGPLPGARALGGRGGGFVGQGEAEWRGLSPWGRIMMLWPRLCFQVLGSRCSWLPAGPAYLPQDWGWGDPRWLLQTNTTRDQPRPRGPRIAMVSNERGRRAERGFGKPLALSSACPRSVPPLSPVTYPVSPLLTSCLSSCLFTWVFCRL